METKPKPQGRPLKEFLDIVHDAMKFINSQQLNDRPLTLEERLMLIEMLKVLLGDY